MQEVEPSERRASGVSVLRRAPARQPRHSSDEPALWGKRVFLSTPEGFVYDMRAITEVYAGSRGDAIDIASEEDYDRGMFTGDPLVESRTQLDSSGSSEDQS